MSFFLFSVTSSFKAKLPFGENISPETRQLVPDILVPSPDLAIDPRYSDDSFSTHNPVSSCAREATGISTPSAVLTPPHKRVKIEVSSGVNASETFPVKREVGKPFSALKGPIKISCLPKPFPKKEPKSLPRKVPKSDDLPQFSPSATTCPNTPPSSISDLYRTPTKPPGCSYPLVSSGYPHSRPPPPYDHIAQCPSGVHPWESPSHNGARNYHVSSVLSALTLPSSSMLILKHIPFLN